MHSHASTREQFQTIWCCLAISCQCHSQKLSYESLTTKYTIKLPDLHFLRFIVEYFTILFYFMVQKSLTVAAKSVNTVWWLDAISSWTHAAISLTCCKYDTTPHTPSCGTLQFLAYLIWMATQQTDTHPFNGPFSGNTQVSRYQKGKTNLDFTEARDSEWQWHQLGHMQVCTSLQTDNHASNPPLSFYRPDALPAAQPTVSKHWRQCTQQYTRNRWYN